MRFFTILVFSIFISSTIFSQKDRHSTSMQDAWLSCTATANPNTVRGTGHWIMYDFKDVYSLHEATFWNFNTPTRLNHYRNMSWSLNLLQGSLEDGLKDIFIDFSLDGIQWQEWGRFTIPKAKGSGFYEGVPGPDFNGKIARYVLITARNNYGGTCYGLGEFKVKATPASVSETADGEKSTILLSISPNPAKDMITVGLEFFPAGEVQYFLHDVKGQLITQGGWVISSELENFSLPVSTYTAGLYILSVQGKELSKSVSFEIIP
ncbi:MAG: T9SS type A sorting domain-containing protein [Saprospiraceae bacterium]|nr:T9SS type A sorting domain-containing protein [Saprospiraceae bacterium]MBK6564800.1 T9SS type A sorting domain-containing protein [Saprospiraceae bacterium]MBK7523444.1 T9SS type A sorting domain-containing protein [Saprospiraceae bacterium]MBK8548832.1 T9SS type A sorting domain-containing protein [Saprospiraceae bacterium]MBK8818940.1 T9SS type A sorting domain-containing protein [Saprospiraceae bacterium]